MIFTPLKTFFYGVICLVFFLTIIEVNDSSAECKFDKDWPARPCYDDGEGGTLIQKLDAWNDYYSFKGKNWLESKRIEMEKAIAKNRLVEWIEEGKLPSEIYEQNNPNQNVWYYYYINGLAPYPKENINQFDSPKQQLKKGVSPNNVICNEGLELIFKFSGNSPACIKPSSFPALAQRGWVK